MGSSNLCFFFNNSLSEHVSPWSQMLGVAGIDYDEDENLKASGASLRPPDATRIRSTGRLGVAHQFASGGIYNQ